MEIGINGVPVTVVRYIKFDDYLKSVHKIQPSRMSTAAKAMFTNEYIAFCITNSVEFEDVAYYKSCLTELGRQRYEAIENICQQIKETTDNEKKIVLEEQLAELRQVDKYKI
jgi:hypothetical protein